MTKKLPLIAGLVLTSMVSLAQEVTGFERIYYSAPEVTEQDNITYTIKNGVSQADHAKFSMKIENNSSDIILFIPKESSVQFEFGEKQPDFNTITLFPGDKKTKTVAVKGSENYLQKAFTYKVGGVYQVSIEGNTVESEPFQLPVAINSFNAENFKVQLKKYSASTKEAVAVFEAIYTGDQIGIINPTNLSVTAKRKKSEETVTYANDDKKSKMEILHKNDKVQFKAVFHIPGKIVDMQFATMHINWNNTFVESEATSLEPVKIDFTMDEELTNEKK